MTLLQVVRRCSRIHGMRELGRFRLRRRELDDSVLGWRELVGSRLGQSMVAPSLTQFHMARYDSESMRLSEMGVSRSGQGVQRFQDRTEVSRWN